MLCDRLYVPTDHLNGLPGGVLVDAFHTEDSDRALSLAAQAIAFISEHLRIVEDP